MVVQMNSERIRRRHLPHWDVPHATYFLTTCLEGSIPAQGLLALQQSRQERQRRQKPSHLSDDEWKVVQWKLGFQEMDRWLDTTPARRELAQPALAQEVVNAIFHFAGIRYDLLAYVVMPSHIHWLFTPIPAWIATLSADESTPRQRIQHSINRYSATQCNKILKVRGTFWQKESFDHWVRDLDELERIIAYIEANPVKAGLVEQPMDWPFSSACFRKMYGIPIGCPLVLP